MKRVLAVLIAIASCTSAFSPQPAPAQGRSQESQGKFRRAQRAVAGQYIVVLKDDLPDGEVASAAAYLSGFHGGLIRHVYQHALKGFSVQLTEAGAMAHSQDPRVEYVEEDGEVSIAQIGGGELIDKATRANSTQAEVREAPIALHSKAYRSQVGPRVNQGECTARCRRLRARPACATRNELGGCS